MTNLTLRSVSKQSIINLIHSHTTLIELKQIHTHLLIGAHLNDPNFLGQFVASIVLKNPKNVDYSNQILDQCNDPTVFALNSMIRAHSKGSKPQKSFHFFNRIIHSHNGISPDNYTFNFLIRACAQLLAKEIGLAVHGCVIKYGFGLDPHVQSGLIFMYAELGCLGFCRQVFDLIPQPDLVCQTAMVSACSKCGDVGFARELFDSMPHRDHIAWSAMIAGYAQCGQSREALALFHLMQLEDVKVSEVSMVSVLSASSQLGALDNGRWAHAYIERNKIPVTVTLGTALVDMYAKCGDMNKAMEVFWAMKEKNVYTWSSAMNGLAMNGAGHKCLELFSLMKKDGVLPNEVTFLSILRACCVIGSVEDGRKYFNAMRKEYGIEPLIDHYGCMVDLYGRCGCLDEALNIINSMPMKPHTGAWGALLNACKLYKNMELGELASRKLIELEGNNHGAYVLLSNIYADSKKWEMVDNVRQAMKVNGVRKQPGCSVIEIDGEAHQFFSGDNSHPRYDDIEAMLEHISRRLKLSGYVTNSKLSLFDVEQEEKKYI
ncbi:LOW QUALITY PROTEIN: putative pentatricopeptide repeat-containing protein At5g40405 [Ricinus communis]|uniref:LOW QUALITY PROTEIN: putative pentatricopeptide repeat-containing protein At5g40405 n=1 Tax=Ricinus communis TaxID=3988 RepID=UPI00201A4A54|nr:LOW QUALITY PROTEIN: putative pentatricopeptide repeat-containing protein At5g40405 [Ricinus communis]